MVYNNVCRVYMYVYMYVCMYNICMCSIEAIVLSYYIYIYRRWRQYSQRSVPYTHAKGSSRYIYIHLLCSICVLYYMMYCLSIVYIILYMLHCICTCYITEQYRIILKSVQQSICILYTTLNSALISAYFSAYPKRRLRRQVDNQLALHIHALCLFSIIYQVSMVCMYILYCVLYTMLLYMPVLLYTVLYCTLYILMP